MVLLEVKEVEGDKKEVLVKVAIAVEVVLDVVGKVVVVEEEVVITRTGKYNIT